MIFKSAETRDIVIDIAANLRLLEKQLEKAGQLLEKDYMNACEEEENEYSGIGEFASHDQELQQAVYDTKEMYEAVKGMHEAVQMLKENFDFDVFV